MRFILVLTFLVLSFNLALSESARTASCEEFVTMRKTLLQISNELAIEIRKGEPCSAAVIDQVRRRHIALDAHIKAGDTLVKHCGYELIAKERKKSINILAKMATYKEMCAITDPHKLDQLLNEDFF